MSWHDPKPIPTALAIAFWILFPLALAYALITWLIN